MGFSRICRPLNCMKSNSLRIVVQWSDVKKHRCTYFSGCTYYPCKFFCNYFRTNFIFKILRYVHTYESIWVSKKKCHGSEPEVVGILRAPRSRSRPYAGGWAQGSRRRWWCPILRSDGLSIVIRVYFPLRDDSAEGHKVWWKLFQSLISFSSLSRICRPLSVSVLCPLSFFLKLIHTLLKLNESRHRYFRPFHPCYIWWNLFVYVSAWQGWHTDAQSTYARIH